MAMRYLEEELRKTGKPQDRQFADRIAKILSSRGQDVPLGKTNISTPGEETSSSLQILVLADNETDDLIKGAEKYVSTLRIAESNKAAFWEKWNSITKPYIELFKEHLPFRFSLSEKLRGRGSKQVLKERRKGNLDIYSKYDLHYSVEKGVAALTRVSSAFGSQYDKAAGLLFHGVHSLEFTCQGDVMTSLVFHFISRGSVNLTQALSPKSALKRQLASWDPKQWGYYDIDIGMSTLTKPNFYIGYPWNNNFVVYEYKASTNEFVNPLSLAQIQHPATVKTAKIHEVAQDILAFIQTSDLGKRE